MELALQHKEIIIKALTVTCRGCGGLGQQEYCKERGNAVWGEMSTCVDCGGKKTQLINVGFETIRKIVLDIVKDIKGVS